MSRPQGTPVVTGEDVERVLTGYPRCTIPWGMGEDLSKRCGEWAAKEWVMVDRLMRDNPRCDYFIAPRCARHSRDLLESVGEAVELVTDVPLPPIEDREKFLEVALGEAGEIALGHYRKWCSQRCCLGNPHQPLHRAVLEVAFQLHKQGNWD